MKPKWLSAVVLLVVTGVCGLFAWFSKKDQDEIDEEMAIRRQGLKHPTMDQSFAHDMAPVQAFRDGGAV
jgi:hypothetical protein